MKIVHLSSSSKGGAGIAALRLHEQLLHTNIDSHFLSKSSGNDEIQNCFNLNDVYSGIPRLKTIFRNSLDNAKITHSGNAAYSQKYLQNKPPGSEYFSFPYSNLYIESCKLVQSADVIHLHWLAEDFINYPTFFPSIGNKRIVWTLHDMNPFTGGCHHSDNCLKFTGKCTDCPQLPPYSRKTIAFINQEVKSTIYSKINPEHIAIVTPSEWLLKLSSQSICFKQFDHHCIINPVNSNQFSPANKIDARNKLGLPEDKFIVLYVSHDVNNPRKGIDNLLNSIGYLNSDVLFCSAGNPTTYEAIHNLGYLNNNDMALAYSAADVFVLPSIAENFPNTIVESLLCGTPVIATRTGGIPEQIGNDGILIQPGNSRELIDAIQFIKENPDNYKRADIRTSALQKFNEKAAVEKYVSIYNQLLIK